MKTSSILLSTDPLEELIERLIPASLGLRVHQLAIASDELTLLLASSQSQARCPVCGQASAGVHSRYTRSLQDLPWGPLRLRLRVQVHRFFCQNPSCLRRIFTEPLPEFAEPYARRTNRLREALLALGWALGGEAGASLCAAHAMPICAATLLNLLRRCGAPPCPTPRVLGVDDWSFQAHSAGTLLVDLERHQPVEVRLGQRRAGSGLVADYSSRSRGHQPRSRGQLPQRSHQRSSTGQTSARPLASAQKCGRSSAKDPRSASGCLAGSRTGSPSR